METQKCFPPPEIGSDDVSGIGRSNMPNYAHETCEFWRMKRYSIYLLWEKCRYSAHDSPFLYGKAPTPLWVPSQVTGPRSGSEERTHQVYLGRLGGP